MKAHSAARSSVKATWTLVDCFELGGGRVAVDMAPRACQIGEPRSSTRESHLQLRILSRRLNYVEILIQFDQF